MKTLGVSAVILLLALRAFAADEPIQARADLQREETPRDGDQPRIEETVVVSATRSERLARDLPVSATVMTREEVENTAGQSVDEVLRSVPGVALAPTNARIHYPSRSRASMRGIPGYSTLVMIDGILINDPFRGYPQWNKVITSDIERIEVVRGANASLWGNYALGGTINIVTRPIDRSEFSARGSWGSHDTRRLNLNLQHSWNARVGAALDYDLSDTDGFLRSLPEVRGPIDVPNWARAENIQLKIDLKPTAGSRNTFRVNRFDDQRSQGTPLSNNTRDAIDVSWNGIQSIGAGGALTYSAFHLDQEFVTTNTSLSSGRVSETVSNVSNSDFRGSGGSVQWSRPISPTVPLLTVGVDARTSDAVETRDDYRTSTTGLNGGKQEITGLFGVVQWNAFRRTEVTMSARVDRWRSFAGYEQTLPNEPTRYDANTTTELDPKVSVRREIGDRSAIRGSVYRAFRAPELRDLYRTGAGRGRAVIPNPFLGPEILTGGEIGWVTSGVRWNGEATLFWNELSDTIGEVTLTSSPSLVLQPQNLGRARSSGAEVIGAFRFNSRWILTGGYSFFDTEVTDNPSNPSIEGNKLVDVPRHLFAAQLRFLGASGLIAELRGRYSSRVYIDANNNDFLEPHAIIDVSGSFPLSRHVEVFLIGENLLDRQYIAEITVDSRLGAPQQFFGGIRLNVPFGG